MQLFGLTLYEYYYFVISVFIVVTAVVWHSQVIFEMEVCSRGVYENTTCVYIIIINAVININFFKLLIKLINFWYTYFRNVTFLTRLEKVFFLNFRLQYRVFHFYEIFF